MSKLNPTGRNVTTNIVAVAANRGEQLAVSANGNLQFKKDSYQTLYETTVSTMLGKGNQLNSADALVQKLKASVRSVVADGASSFDFIANLAIHARTEMNVRTIPIVLVVEFAKALADQRQPLVARVDAIEQELTTARKAKRATSSIVERLTAAREDAEIYTYGNMRQLVNDVIQRADQITDLYAYALQVFGGKNKIPMAIKRGVADAFNKFSEYAFAKYNRDGAVKFRDVLRIVHPTASTIKQGEIFDKIMKDTLSVPYTWETELSANGQKPVAERLTQKQLWTQLVTSGKVGYMALLRNLRNIISAGLDDDVVKKHVLDVISDPARVAKSKQLPYDFIEAYNIVKPLDGRFATAVSKALDASAANLPELGKRVWLIVDYSGSMGHGPTSAFGGGVFLASALLKAAGSTASRLAVTLFGSTALTLKDVDTNHSMLGLQQILESYRKDGISGSTNFRAALDQKSQLGFEPDTIIVITDGEVNGFPYGVIKNVAGRSVMKMAVNMSVATSTPMSQHDGWYSMAGWSPAMFKWIPAMRDAGSVIEQLAVPYKGVPSAKVEE